MKTCSFSALAVILAAGLAFAQDEESAPAQADGEATEVKQTVKASAAKAFSALPFCRLAEGTAEVLKPGAEGWASVEEGKFYPLGSAYRTSGAKARLEIAFGSESKVSISGNAAFATKAQPIGEASRTVIVQAGTLELDLARNLPEGAFFVSAPGFMVKNPAGESKIVYSPMGDGDEAVVRCVTGTLGVEGRHYDIAQMRAANEVRIRSSQDYLFTSLLGTSGNYVVSLDCGVEGKPVPQDDGSVKTEATPVRLDWHLSPETRVEIVRQMPAIGERMSVMVTTFDAAGQKQNERVYTEGRAEVNSGELVPKDPTDAEEISKKAAEASEEETTAAEDEEKSEESDNNN